MGQEPIPNGLICYPALHGWTGEMRMGQGLSLCPSKPFSNPNGAWLVLAHSVGGDTM